MAEQQAQQTPQAAAPKQKPRPVVAKVSKVKKWIPSFKRQNWAQKRRVERTGWRKPRGIDNKLRVHKKGFGFLPRIGFRNAKATRGLHPIGLKEVLVYSLKELAGLKNVAVRISAGIGKKKKIVIVAEAKKLGLRILNE
ncbi:TPA: 50S ribosomal protein L32e [Candidatus Micrarchaeota archaeon]|nr:50S ribosomal protein L32e [Candidatus Micrarchaeota archaeon]